MNSERQWLLTRGGDKGGRGAELRNSLPAQNPSDRGHCHISLTQAISGKGSESLLPHLTTPWENWYATADHRLAAEWSALYGEDRTFQGASKTRTGFQETPELVLL